MEKFIKINLSFLSSFENIYRITTLGSGNCYFHSVMRGHSTDYQNSDDETRVKKCIEFRDILADMLEEKDETGLTRYDKLNNGIIKDFSKGHEPYTLINLQKNLRSREYIIDGVFQEIISDELDIDIYVSDYKNNDIFMVGSELESLYKGRKSIVLLCHKNLEHYEILGIKSPEDNHMYTMFAPNHDLIVFLYERLISYKYGFIKR